MTVKFDIDFRIFIETKNDIDFFHLYRACGSLVSLMRKRRIEDSQMKPRKRFVWPDDLHRTFIAAVFDVGLRAASPKAIHKMLPENIPDVSLEHVKSNLHKLRLQRLHQCGVVEGNLPLGGSGQNSGACKPPRSEPSTHDDRLRRLRVADGERQHRVMRAQESIRKQVETIEQSLLVLANFQREIGDTMQEQHRIHDTLSTRIQWRDYIPSNDSNPNPLTAEFRGGTTDINGINDPQLRPFSTTRQRPGDRIQHSQKPSHNGSSLPQRAQMEKEMQDHMNMHRTMLMHMDHQLAQFDGQGWNFAIRPMVVLLRPCS